MYKIKLKMQNDICFETKKLKVTLFKNQREGMYKQCHDVWASNGEDP